MTTEAISGNAIPEEQTSLIDGVRIVGEVIRVFGRISLAHPTFVLNTPAQIFGGLSPEKANKRKKLHDRLMDQGVAEVATWQLTRRIGTQAHRGYLASKLREISDKYDPITS